MKELGYSEGYRYAHDEEEGISVMECLPENLRGRRYYQPSKHGLEKSWAERLRQLEQLRRDRARQK